MQRPTNRRRSPISRRRRIACCESQAAPVAAPAVVSDIAIIWAADAEKELRKIPFFVRGKARRNTERFANENGLATITIETLYDAKAHYAR